MVIEITTFRLAGGASEADFLLADKRVQTEVVPHHAGFARRTTARSDDGSWGVVTLWWSVDDGIASRALADSHPAQSEFDALVDPSSVTVARYTTLD